MAYASMVFDALKGKIASNRGMYKYPTSVASANDLDLSNKKGNYYKITGTTTINGIKKSGAIVGAEIALEFAGILTLTNNGSPSTGYGKVYTKSAANVTTAATNVVYLVFDGTNWRESGFANAIDNLASGTVPGLVKGTVSTAGAATSITPILVGKKTGIADNTATSIITVTMPNVNGAFCIELTLLGSLGAGTDTFESTRCAKGMIVCSRKAGDNIVPAAATLTLAQISTDSGGGTLTLAYGVSSVTGAAGATNTFDIQVTLVKTGTITDLQCAFTAVLLNAETGGATMALAA